MMNPSPHFHFHSTLPFPPLNDPYSPQLQRCHFWPFPLKFNSKFDDSLAFKAEISPTFGCEESIEDGARTNRELTSATASPLPSWRKSERGKKGGRARKKSKHPVYKGVRKRQQGKWVSEIREPGKKSRIWLGTFSTPEMAAIAYDVAAFNLKTPYAYLNFPEAVSSLPVPLSRSAKDIQAAASMAAAALRGGATASSSRMGGVVPTSQPHQTTASLSASMPIREQLLPQSTSPPTTAPPFFDDDMIFDMPNVLADMAEGLLISPPLRYHGTDADSIYNNGHGEYGAQSPLWSI